MNQPGGPTLIPGIAEAICGRILRGELREGEVIHQTELAKELGVSPVPLREALRRLSPPSRPTRSAKPSPRPSPSG